MDNIYELDPEILFETTIYDVYTELGDVTKGNVLNKLWKVIKNTARSISDTTSTIVNGIGSLFQNRGNIVIGTKLAEDAGLEPNDKIGIPNFGKYPSGDTEDAIIGKMVASMIRKINRDRFTIICPAKLVEVNPNSEDIKVHGSKINASWDRTRKVLKLIENPAPIISYKAFFSKVLNEIPDTVEMEYEIHKLYNDMEEFAGRSPIKDYVIDGAAQIVHDSGGSPRGEYTKVTITVQSLIDFQRIVNEMCDLAEKFDSKFYTLTSDKTTSRSELMNSLRKKYIDILNEISWTCVELQGGLHAIANGLKGVYDVSLKYHGSVKTPEQLAAFVDKAIPTGMPGKYIVRNIINICDPIIKGNVNIDDPIMGFGRLTLIPEGDIVYKVAINQYGIRSNKNDFTVIKILKDIDDPSLTELFADSIRYYGNYSVNVVEKVDAGPECQPSILDANRLANEINEKFKNHGINISIQDIKPDGFGMRGPKYVLIDYGYTHRHSNINESVFRMVNNPMYRGGLSNYLLEDNIDIGYDEIE